MIKKLSIIIAYTPLMATISFEKEKYLETKPDNSIVNLAKVLYDKEENCDRVDVSLLQDNIHTVSFKFDGKVPFPYIIDFIRHVEKSFEDRFSKVYFINKTFRTIYHKNGQENYFLAILTLKVEDKEDIKLDIYYG